MENIRSDSEVNQDIIRRLDKDGELSRLAGSFEELLGWQLGRWLLRTLKVDVSELSRMITTQNQLLSDTARALLVFGRRGWASTGLNPASIIRSALEAYDQNSSIEEAESILCEGWNQSGMLTLAQKRLLTIGTGDERLREIAAGRYRLVGKALAHHEAGAYEASVPIILAQIDGIMLDITEGHHGFFVQVRQGEHLRDTETLAGMHEGLFLLQKHFGAMQNITSSSGGISRHGILHGRELGYDTRINSTKCIVLLLAVIEWAQPRSRALVDRRRDERDARFAGVDGVDEQGRRLDFRGFRGLREELSSLWADELIALQVTGSFQVSPKRPFGKRPSVEVAIRVSEDGRRYSSWGTTPSGWILGTGAAADSPLRLYYAGPVVPPEDVTTLPWTTTPPPDFS